MSIKNNVYKKFIVLLLVLLLVTSLFLIIKINKNDKVEVQNNEITVAFYNVENLFDTVDAPDKEDDEFLPNTKKNWNKKRYNKKINDLSRVFQSLDNTLPEIIGLAEIENITVLNDLCNNKQIKSGNYKIIHFESPDHRGIDCALLYKKDALKIISKEPLKYYNPKESHYTSRDILYVKGKTNNDEILHIFVNHWPSRRGGVEKTEHRRVAAANILRKKVDQLLKKDANANIIIMGDMNDTPANKSLFENLGAKQLKDPKANLVNLMFDAHNNKKGSYNFRGNWQAIDNLIVSKSLLDTNGYRVKGNTAMVYHQNWMTYTNKLGQSSPNKTYGGPKYYGGISDHFPIFLTLSLN